MSRRAVALSGTIVALLVTAGCAANGADAVADGSPDHTTAPTLPAFPEPTTPQSGRPVKATDLVLVDVRVTAAEGFDRIVLEFSGTGTPGWSVDYADDAVVDGSGETVDLKGRATLDIYASDTTWPAPDYYDGPRRLTPRNPGAIDAVYVAGTFEGTTQVLAGLDRDAPYRVFTRTAPSRLVIDVQRAT